MACAGQQKMAFLGYSPLPPNLVQEDFDAIGRLNGGVRAPDGPGRHLQEPLCRRPDPAARRAGSSPGRPARPQGCGVKRRTPAIGRRQGGSSAAGRDGRDGRRAGASGGTGAGSGSAGRPGGAPRASPRRRSPPATRVVNGHIVKSLDAGPSKFAAGRRPVSASKGHRRYPGARIAHLGAGRRAASSSGIPLIGVVPQAAVG